MTRLNSVQRELIFDYCIGLANSEQIVEARALISSNEEAKEIHSKIQAALAPLEYTEIQACPDELVDKTLLRVNAVAGSSTDRLRQLIASEQEREILRPHWPYIDAFRRLATAAVFVVAGAVLFTTFNYMRFDSQRQRCQMQQSGFFRGLGSYMADHDGKQPALPMQAGAPWYKVGYQGNENHSNTRRVYLLVKNGYVEPDSFVCPACSKSNDAPKLTASEIKAYKDFPDRRYITYSFQVNCRQGGDGELHCRKVLMADLSPLFENIPDDLGKPFQLRLDRKLLTINSVNHKRKGQNVLFGDGHVEFLKKRFPGVSTDDIFTLQDTDVYHGCEVPACTTDLFVAP